MGFHFIIVDEVPFILSRLELSKLLKFAFLGGQSHVVQSFAE